MKEQENQQDSQLQAVNYQQDTDTNQQQAQRKPNNTGMPDRLKAVVEHFSGCSLDEVRVHYNSDKPAEIGALAYAEYPNIYIAPGEERHLAEEVWHIVQQMKGEAKPNTEFQGNKKGNDDPSLEQKAVKEGGKMEKTALPQEEETAPLETSIPQPVAQRAVANQQYATNEYYQEGDMGLERITAQEYEESGDDDEVTHEEGFTIFNINNQAELEQWELNANVLELVRQRGRGQIRKVQNTFSLPVSCIESAEHIVHYAHAGGAIPDWAADQADDKSVALSFANDQQNNEEALNISEDEITQQALQGYTDYDFNAGGLEVGEGILVVRADDPATSVHAVAVVGKNNNTGQIIVLERNAGTTAGNTDYTDANWTLNIYNSATAFKNSMPNSQDYIMGKLATPVQQAQAIEAEEQ